MNHSPGLKHKNRSEEQATLDLLASKQLYPQHKLEFVRALLETAEREANRLADNIPMYEEAYDRLEELRKAIGDGCISDCLPHAESSLNDWANREAEREYLSVGARR